jgi:hypothetical protein
MFAQSIYGPGRGTAAQETVNPNPGTASATVATPGKQGSGTWGTVPVLGGASDYLGIPVPMLIAMGALAWWLFRQY